MILISHRGNITRPIPERENDPKYIHEAIVNGFNVEVDVWFIKGKFKLGHDKPTYDFPYQLLELQSNKLWIHWDAKYVEDRSGESSAEGENWRNMTKQYSREWLDYAKISSQPVVRPRNLCISAAGTADFCEAGVED